MLNQIKSKPFKFLGVSALFISTALLSGCADSPPTNQNNICSIFYQYPKWYWATKKTAQKWKVPISVQMAIIKQESSFVADARPPRTWLLGFIPWSRPTTAFGYAQATDGTWDHYMSKTGDTDADRDNFSDASNFIGWYATSAKKRANIHKNNAYELYLAYHEGIGGYIRKSYNKKPWLLKVARKVERTAEQYQIQLQSCKNDIPRPSIWNLWFF